MCLYQLKIGYFKQGAISNNGHLQTHQPRNGLIVCLIEYKIVTLLRLNQWQSIYIEIQTVPYKVSAYGPHLRSWHNSIGSKNCSDGPHFPFIDRIYFYHLHLRKMVRMTLEYIHTLYAICTAIHVPCFFLNIVSSKIKANFYDQLIFHGLVCQFKPSLIAVQLSVLRQMRLNF